MRPFGVPLARRESSPAQIDFEHRSIRSGHEQQIEAVRFRQQFEPGHIPRRTFSDAHLVAMCQLVRDYSQRDRTVERSKYAFGRMIDKSCHGTPPWSVGLLLNDAVKSL